jgi:thioredoxin-related protein
MQSRIPIIVFLLLFFIAGNAQNPAATIPEFNFEKQDRSVFTKKDLPPGFFSFFVFFDTECDHCQHAIEYLNKHQPELARAKLYLLTLDSREKVLPFLEKYGSKLKKTKNTLLLFDTKNQFITRFGPRKYPSLMLYSKDGKLLLYDDEEKNLPGFMEKIKSPGS